MRSDTRNISKGGNQCAVAVFGEFHPNENTLSADLTDDLLSTDTLAASLHYIQSRRDPIRHTKLHVHKSHTVDS